MKTLILLTIFTIISTFIIYKAQASDTKVITCGSVIKLKHKSTGVRLHSHDVKYGTGSRQQSVTGFPSATDANSYWVIEGSYEKPCEPGVPIKNKDVIRLKHASTKKYLHSHRHQSPLTGQQEVSCLEPLNSGDNWQVMLGTNKEWKKGTSMRLYHVDTGMYLHSHSHKFGNPIPNQQEITAYARYGDAQNIWMVEEGIFLGREHE
mmetsp:Transcript_2688/g.3873  ORF Transcript_2688/g.3873 Transcript_2688/m.3873 type:complete len:206 (+) Transcript_2688:69-686(+)